MTNTAHTIAEKRMARSYLIGDPEGGLTFVLTDPVMIVHYTAEDLKDASINQLHNESIDVIRAAVVRLLVPHLRGVDVPELEAHMQRIEDEGHDKFEYEQIVDGLKELDLATSIGQMVAKGQTVFDVDFCVSINVPICDVAQRGRSTDPAVSICDYIEMNAGCPEGPSTQSPWPVEEYKIQRPGEDPSGAIWPKPWPEK